MIRLPASAPGPSPGARDGARRTDAVVALVLFAIGLTLLSAGIGPFIEIPAALEVSDLSWQLVPLTFGCLAVTMQSRRPRLSFVLATVAFWGDVLIGLHMAVLGVWVSVVYAAGRHAPARSRALVRRAVVLTCAAVALWVLFLGHRLGDAVLGTLQVGVFAALALWLSSDARSGDDRAETERLRTEQVLQRAIQEQAALLSQERAHLGAQFHDTVSSNLSSIALFTTGALDRPPDPERDRAVLREARQAALDGLTDMRALIDILRNYDISVADVPEAEQVSIEEIVARLEPAGLEVDVDLEPVDLSPSREHALSQVAREALTNALKHGDGRATVRLVTTGDTVRLTVSNGLPSRDAGGRDTPAINGGIGLGSMAARVSAVGGRFRSGEVDTPNERRWSVHAELPVGESEGIRGLT